MKQIKDHSKMLESDTDCILRLLAAWEPQSFELTEKKQEQALQSWLQGCLPDVPIVQQYGIAKGKADLVIEDSHVIELKLAFTDDTLVEFDRCIGQLERYRQKWVVKERGPVYLVVVGTSGVEFRDMLRNTFEHLNRDYGDQPFLYESKRFFLVEKIANE